MEDLLQNVAFASVLVTRRHKSIAVICIEMFGNPDFGNGELIWTMLIYTFSNPLDNDLTIKHELAFTCNCRVDCSDECPHDDPQGKHQVQVSERDQVGNYLKLPTLFCF